MDAFKMSRSLMSKAAVKVSMGTRAVVASFRMKSDGPKIPTTSASDYGLFRSDSEAQIAKVAVIEVKGNTAICDGGGGALGHPIEYIQLNTVKNEPQVCKYCGLRFIKAAGHHGHH